MRLRAGTVRFLNATHQCESQNFIERVDRTIQQCQRRTLWRCSRCGHYACGTHKPIDHAGVPGTTRLECRSWEAELLAVDGTD